MIRFADTHTRLLPRIGKSFWLIKFRILLRPTPAPLLCDGGANLTAIWVNLLEQLNWFENFLTNNCRNWTAWRRLSGQILFIMLLKFNRWHSARACLDKTTIVFGKLYELEFLPLFQLLSYFRYGGQLDFFLTAQKWSNHTSKWHTWIEFFFISNAQRMQFLRNKVKKV